MNKSTKHIAAFLAAAIVGSANVSAAQVSDIEAASAAAIADMMNE